MHVLVSMGHVHVYRYSTSYSSITLVAFKLPKATVRYEEIGTYPNVDLGAFVGFAFEELGRGVGRTSAAGRQRTLPVEAVAEAEVCKQRSGFDS